MNSPDHKPISIKVAFVGSAVYPAREIVEDKVGKFAPDVWPGCSIQVGGDDEFCARVLGLAATQGTPAIRSPVGLLGRMVGGGAADGRRAARACDFLVAFWDGKSRDATQAAAEVMLKLGKVFEVYGPEGRIIRAGNDGEEVHVPGVPGHR